MYLGSFEIELSSPLGDSRVCHRKIDLTKNSMVEGVYGIYEDQKVAQKDADHLNARPSARRSDFKKICDYQVHQVIHKLTTKIPFPDARSVFMKELERLHDKARTEPEQISKTCKQLRDLFKNNRDLAYSIGLDESMSYRENPAQDILDRAGDASVGSWWLPSSWERC